MWPNLPKDSGTGVATVMFLMRINASSSANGTETNIKIYQISTTGTSVTLSGGVSWLYNIFLGVFKDRINAAISVSVQNMEQNKSFSGPVASLLNNPDAVAALYWLLTLVVPAVFVIGVGAVAVIACI